MLYPYRVLEEKDFRYWTERGIKNSGNQILRRYLSGSLRTLRKWRKDNREKKERVITMITFKQIRFLLLLVALIATGCTDVKTSPVNNLERVDEINVQKEGYESWVITGALRNRGKETLNLVSISIPICNDANERISEAMDSTNGLKPGQTWRFRAYVVFESRWKMCDGASPVVTAF